MYNDIFGQMKKQLGQLDKWLEAAAANANSRSFDPSVLLAARLAPDQFALARQVQVTCDTAKFAASRITGKDAPKQEDNEKTLDDLRARVQSVIKYLDGYAAKDFEKSDTHVVTTPRWEGKTMT